MAGTQNMDLTRGSPLRQILLFAVPLVVGTLLQQLYAFVDTAMVGRILGEDALAAVGTTHSLNFLTLGFAQGTCLGFGIPLANAVGAKNKEEMQRLFCNGVWICAAFAFLMTALTLALAVPMLHMIRTPQEIFADAKRYLIFIFCGMPAVVLYNFTAGVLRALGDSRHPTTFLLLSCALNILLDYVFLVPIPLGVVGAALATVLSQLFSGLLNLGWLIRKTDMLRATAAFRRPSRHRIGLLCRAGFPMGLEYSLSALGTVVVQGAINSLGTASIAAQTTGEKVRQMFTLPMASVGTAMATYVGQNMGAKRYDRVRDGIKAAMVILLVYAAGAWAVLGIGRSAFAALVLGAHTGEASLLAVRYLQVMGWSVFLAGASSVMRNVLQGMGRSTHAMFSGICQLAGSALGGWLATACLGFWGVCLANPLAWTLAALYCTVLVFYYLRKQKKL